MVSVNVELTLINQAPRPLIYLTVVFTFLMFGTESYCLYGSSLALNYVKEAKFCIDTE